ncbi:MAG: hypothetical protein IJZ59_05690 [Alphaproteobacteria bacterium]|nr:hypothetical protein [Alphaproteobacteria bacterium]
MKNIFMSFLVLFMLSNTLNDNFVVYNTETTTETNEENSSPTTKEIFVRGDVEKPSK